MSQGRSPSWWREDQLIWAFTVNIGTRNRRLALTVNPHGAYSFDSTAPEPGVMDGIMAAAQTVGNEWTMEAAIPLVKLADIGFVSVERSRSPPGCSGTALVLAGAERAHGFRASAPFGRKPERNRFPASPPGIVPA